MSENRLYLIMGVGASPSNRLFKWAEERRQDRTDHIGEILLRDNVSPSDVSVYHPSILSGGDPEAWIAVKYSQDQGIARVSPLDVLNGNKRKLTSDQLDDRVAALEKLRSEGNAVCLVSSSYAVATMQHYHEALGFSLRKHSYSSVGYSLSTGKITVIDDERKFRSEQEAVYFLYEFETEMRKAIRKNLFEGSHNSDIDEVMSEVIRRVRKNWYRFNGEGARAGWMRKTATNAALNYIRAVKSYERGLTVLTESGWLVQTAPSPEELWIERQTHEAINHAKGGLPEGQRVVWEMLEEGLGGEDIARELDISPTTVRTREHRAKKVLMAAVDAQEHTFDDRQ